MGWYSRSVMSNSKPDMPTGPELKPLGLVGSIVWMGGPGVLMLVLLRFGIPMAMDLGISQLFAFWGAIYIPCLVAGVVAVVCYRRDGYAMNWNAFSKRMRLGRLSGKACGIALVATILVIVLENGVLNGAPAFLAQFAPFAPPGWLEAPINPLKEWNMTTFQGTELAGNWWLPLVYIPGLLCNILGEEICWRGYMLPRQELVFGKWAWLVNGVFWMVLFHLAMPWIWLAVIPSLVLVPLSSQWLKSTWVPIIIHGTGNSLLLLLLLWGAAGSGL